ncbi:MAG: hypothetical protein U0R70_11145 [Solirubrobacteraceae bacterium]
MTEGMLRLGPDLSAWPILDLLWLESFTLDVIAAEEAGGPSMMLEIWRGLDRRAKGELRRRLHGGEILEADVRAWAESRMHSDPGSGAAAPA